MCQLFSSRRRTADTKLFGQLLLISGVGSVQSQLDAGCGRKQLTSLARLVLLPRSLRSMSLLELDNATHSVSPLPNVVPLALSLAEV